MEWLATRQGGTEKAVKEWEDFLRKLEAAPPGARRRKRRLFIP